MYNTKLVITAFVCVSILACKKNSAPPLVKQQEMPLQNLVTAKFLDTISIVNNDRYEEGYSFSSSKNGRIIKLGCYMPNNLPYRVTLWDSATKNAIVTVPVKVTDSTKFTYAGITPVSIAANKTYIVTINNTVGGVQRSYFRLGKKPNINFDLPTQSGSIKITAYRDDFGCTTTCFPNNNAIVNVSLFGIPDFVFEPEN